MGNYEYLLEEMMSEMDSFSMNVDILGIVSYIFLALGLYTIAQRRGISKPWLAWIPVANVWLLGCISDQYRYVALGEVKSKRKVLLGLEIAMIILMVITITLAVGAIFNIVESGVEILDEGWNFTDEGIDALASLLPAVGVLLVMCVLSVVRMVLAFVAYHDIFASCDPGNKTIFTTLGVILAMFGLDAVLSILVFICRKKDDGMPPLRQAEAEQSTWQPPQQTQEPWEI